MSALRENTRSQKWGGAVARASRWLAGAVTLALLVSGCQQQVAIEPLPSASGSTSTATVAPSATLTATAIPTATPTATQTPAPTLTPTATPVPLRLQVRQSVSTVAQGSTLAVYVTANRRCQIEGAFGQRVIPFTPLDDVRSVAFVGVHALAEVGDAMLSVSAVANDGQRVELETPIQIVAGDYAHETLTFSAEISKLLDPAITGPELERLAEIYGQHTDAVAWQGLFQWPVEGPITSAFGTRRQYGDAFASYHAGIDIDGETGDSVAACAAGTVVLAEALQVRGNAVIIDHGAGVLSGYYHLSQIDVEVGQQVAQGEVIGLMGSTGLVTGSHLHWELGVGGVPVSPSEWLDELWIAQG